MSFLCMPARNMEEEKQVHEFTIKIILRIIMGVHISLIFVELFILWRY